MERLEGEDDGRVGGPRRESGEGESFQRDGFVSERATEKEVGSE